MLNCWERNGENEHPNDEKRPNQILRYENVINSMMKKKEKKYEFLVFWLSVLCICIFFFGCLCRCVHTHFEFGSWAECEGFKLCAHFFFMFCTSSIKHHYLTQILPLPFTSFCFSGYSALQYVHSTGCIRMQYVCMTLTYRHR